jgi:hypothetical protein
MKRFTKAYLIIVFIGTLLANLIFIILYGQQFLFEAAEDCSNCPPMARDTSLAALWWLNLALIGLFVIGFIAVRLLNHQVEAMTPTDHDDPPLI